MASRDHAAVLRAVKIVHTIAWAFFASCIFMIPVFTLLEQFGRVAMLTGIVLLEVAILAFNGMRCPLTDVAARYTDDRRPNFDIYLPLWLARHNKLIFGLLFAGSLVFVFVRSMHWL